MPAQFFGLLFLENINSLTRLSRVDYSLCQKTQLLLALINSTHTYTRTLSLAHTNSHALTCNHSFFTSVSPTLKYPKNDKTEQGVFFFFVVFHRPNNMFNRLTLQIDKTQLVLFPAIYMPLWYNTCVKFLAFECYTIILMFYLLKFCRRCFIKNLELLLYTV